MKKIVGILIIALAFGVIVPIQAQIRFGIKGGANLMDSNLRIDNKHVDNFTGFHFGPMVDIGIPIIGIGIDGAFMYSQRGMKIEDVSYKENGIEVPVNLKYTFGLGDFFGVYLAAGPSFFFNFSGDKKTDNGILHRKNAQTAINLGGGLKLFNHLQLGINYNIPLTKSEFDDPSTGTRRDTYKIKGWQVSLAYLF